MKNYKQIIIDKNIQLEIAKNKIKTDLENFKRLWSDCLQVLENFSSQLNFKIIFSDVEYYDFCTIRAYSPLDENLIIYSPKKNWIYITNMYLLNKTVISCRYFYRFHHSNNNNNIIAYDVNSSPSCSSTHETTINTLEQFENYLEYITNNIFKFIKLEGQNV